MFHIWEDQTRFSEIFIYVFLILTSHFAAECTVCTTIELTFEKQVQSHMGGQETVFRNLCGHPSRLDGCESGFIYDIRVYIYIYDDICVSGNSLKKSISVLHGIFSSELTVENFENSAAFHQDCLKTPSIQSMWTLTSIQSLNGKISWIMIESMSMYCNTLLQDTTATDFMDHD